MGKFFQLHFIGYCNSTLKFYYTQHGILRASAAHSTNQPCRCSGHKNDERRAHGSKHPRSRLAVQQKAVTTDRKRLQQIESGYNILEPNGPIEFV